MNVEGAAAVVALVDDPLAADLHPPGDVRRHKIAVENHYQPRRYVKQGGIGRQPNRDRRASLVGFLLQQPQLLGQPGAQVSGQVIPQGDVVALAVLLVGGIEGEAGHRVVEAQVRHGEGCEFALTQPGQHQRLVDQRPLPPEPLQPRADFRAHVGVALALPRPLADGEGFEQRPLPGYGEQLDQFGLRHRPPLPARVGLLVGLGHGVERVDGEPVRLDAPVAERHQRVAVGVAGPGRHAFGGALGEPALQGVAAQVGERPEGAVGGEPAQVAAGVLAVNLRHPLGLVVLIEGAEVLREGRRLMVTDGSLGGGHHP